MYDINIPKEIEEFLKKAFMIMEVRGNVGNWNSVTFEIRTKETPHNNPHVHASYGEYSISIDIITLETTGNLPKSKYKSSVEWVKRNREYLLGKWNSIAISAKMPFTKSALDFEKIAN